MADLTPTGEVFFNAFEDELNSMAKEAGVFRGLVGAAKGLMKKPTNAFTPGQKLTGRLSQAKQMGAEGLKSNKTTRAIAKVDAMPTPKPGAGGAGAAKPKPPTKEQLVGDLQPPSMGASVAKVPPPPAGAGAGAPSFVDDATLGVAQGLTGGQKAMLGIGGAGLLGGGAYLAGRSRGRQQGMAYALSNR